MALQVLCFAMLKEYIDGSYHLTPIPGLMHGKIAIVTGASAGIGEDLTLRLAERGAFVIMGCRNLNNCEFSRSSYGEFANNTVCAKIDLSDFNSVKSFADSIKSKYDGIDYLAKQRRGGVFPK